MEDVRGRSQLGVRNHAEDQCPACCRNLRARIMQQEPQHSNFRPPGFLYGLVKSDLEAWTRTRLMHQTLPSASERLENHPSRLGLIRCQ